MTLELIDNHNANEVGECFCSPSFDTIDVPVIGESELDEREKTGKAVKITRKEKLSTLQIVNKSERDEKLATSSRESLRLDGDARNV
jgi:hypothetical protein